MVRLSSSVGLSFCLFLLARFSYLSLYFNHRSMCMSLHRLFDPFHRHCRRVLPKSYFFCYSSQSNIVIVDPLCLTQTASTLTECLFSYMSRFNKIDSRQSKYYILLAPVNLKTRCLPANNNLVTLKSIGSFESLNVAKLLQPP